MKIQDIMSTNIEMLKPTQSVRVAARKMSQLGIGVLPVVTEQGSLVGLITDRDISCYIVAMGRDPNSTEVQKCMTTNLITCYDDQAISEAAQLMEVNNVQRLMVLDRNDILIGIVSVDDIAFFSRDLAGTVLQSAKATH
ncbi:MAG: CBS domain-containing protein [Gammaproteobacteria bacterium]